MHIGEVFAQYRTQEHNQEIFVGVKPDEVTSKVVSLNSAAKAAAF